MTDAQVMALVMIASGVIWLLVLARRPAIELSAPLPPISRK